MVADPDAAERVRALHAVFSRPSTALERQSRFLELASLLVARHREVRVEVRRARDYFEAHVAKSVALGELAGEAGLSVFHFVRVFRAELGVPPHAWHVEVRVRGARALLRSGLAPALVAGELGFVDQSHLTREFKRRG